VGTGQEGWCTMLKVVDNEWTSVADVAKGLRALADELDAELEAEGKITHNIAYVVDRGAGDVFAGLLGQATQPAVTCHWLLAIGQHKMVKGALDE